jgi:hypothetical protein
MARSPRKGSYLKRRRQRRVGLVRVLLDRGELTALALLLLRQRGTGFTATTRADLARARARVVAALARSAAATYQRR